MSTSQDCRTFDECAKLSANVADKYWRGEYIAANIAASDVLASMAECANKLTPDALNAFCNAVKDIEERMSAGDYYSVADYLAFEIPYILTKM